MGENSILDALSLSGWQVLYKLFYVFLEAEVFKQTALSNAALQFVYWPIQLVKDAQWRLRTVTILTGNWFGATSSLWNNTRSHFSRVSCAVSFERTLLLFFLGHSLYSHLVFFFNLRGSFSYDLTPRLHAYVLQGCNIYFAQLFSLCVHIMPG